MRTLLIFLFTLILQESAYSQDSREHRSENPGFLEASPEFHAARFYGGMGVAALGYGATMYGLSKVWYKNGSVPFHFYNDFGEWEHMDKLGHSYTSYMYASLIYNGSRWSGVNKKNSLWIAGGASTFFQLSLEFMDAFQEDWGFSTPDVIANSLGTGIFITQKALWDEQFIRLKYSTFPRSVDEALIFTDMWGDPYSLSELSGFLYGENLSSQLLKNYNNQIYWFSLNPSKLLNGRRFPQWFNIAVGYGIRDVYGGYENTVKVPGIEVGLIHVDIPRRRVFYLSPDIDWQEVQWNSDFMKALSKTMNLLKTPAPAISVDTEGNFQFHIFLF